MKTKLEMAHEYLLRFSGTTVADAWQYADAMQAEADKRELKGLPDSLRERHDFTKAIAKGVENYEKEKWQPDWSQAPDWAEYWTADELATLWWSVKPKFDSSESWHGGPTADIEKAPSFGYTGDWRESLRKRPK